MACANGGEKGLASLKPNFGFHLLFAEGERPRVEAITRAFDNAGVDGIARISHRSADAEGWVELLANGYTFDLTGLAPASPEAVPAIEQFDGVPRVDDAQPFEALLLSPGPHLHGGAALQPVLRSMAGLAVRLIETLPVSRIAWSAAMTCMGTDYFRNAVGGWLLGGAFPAPGLTAIVEGKDRAARSRGLGFFIGQEMVVDPRRGEAFADTALLAAWIVGELIEIGPIDAAIPLTAPNGERLMAQPAGRGHLIRVRRAQ